jgi:CheY-like chemotaxis protein
MNLAKRVILIDDSEITNYYNTELLRSIGVDGEVRSFTSVDTAWNEIVRLGTDPQAGPTLVLLDVKMPGNGGFDLLWRLEEEEVEIGSQMVICMLTSSNLKSDQEEYAKFPLVREFIVKPLDEGKLRAAFEHVGPVTIAKRA